MLTLPLLVAPRFITAGVQIAKKVRASIGKRQNYSSLQLVIEDADGILPKYFGLGGMTCAAAAGLALLPDDNADVAPARNLFRAALERLPSVKSAEGSILTDGFLDLCRLTLPLIDSFGPAFGMVSHDISTNVERLRKRAATDPARFRLLYPIVLDEVARREDDHPQSCTKAVLWLKRGMEFMLAIMAALQERPDAAMSDVVGEIYHKTIHRWHGFLTSSAFTVAFAFVPSREAFLNRLAGGKYCGRTAADMAAYVDQFSALLAEVHKFLDKHGLDDPRRV